MRTQSLIDKTFNINPVAWAILSLLDTEPVGIPYDGVARKYTGDVGTFPLYNGRERGFVLVLKKNHWDIDDCLHIFFAENRNSDEIVVYNWTGHSDLNPPTVRDIPEESYQSRKYYKTTESAVDAINTLISDYYAE